MENILGHRLMVLRHERRFSQRALAKQASISQKHLSQIEHGRQPLLAVAGGTVRCLASLLGVTTDYLLGMDLLEKPGHDAPREEPPHAHDPA